MKNATPLILPILWYENVHGNRWVPPEIVAGGPVTPPPGFIYMHTRFPRRLVHDVLELLPGGGSRPMMRMEGGWQPDLVAALFRPTLRERARQFLRTRRFVRKMSLPDAILLAGVACEGCMHIIAHKAGVTWGYAAGSPEHLTVGTSCELCRTEDERVQAREEASSH
jgi:hypothetical protein